MTHENRTTLPTTTGRKVKAQRMRYELSRSPSRTVWRHLPSIIKRTVWCRALKFLGIMISRRRNENLFSWIHTHTHSQHTHIGRNRTTLPTTTKQKLGNQVLQKHARAHKPESVAHLWKESSINIILKLGWNCFFSMKYESRITTKCGCLITSDRK